MLSKLDVTTIFSVDELKKICIPNVLNGKGCYMPILDTVSRSSMRYPFLGNTVVLSLKNLAAFILKHRLPVIPFFTVEDQAGMPKTVLEIPLDPGPSDSIEIFETWILSILERYVLAYPELVNWYLWWKNSLRFDLFES